MSDIKNLEEITPDMRRARKRIEEPKEIVFEYRKDLKDKYKGLNFLLNTYGCQANEADSEFMNNVLTYMGFTRVYDYENADFIMLNTCAIRETAENRVFGELGRMIKYIRKNPKLKVAISGCMPQEEVTVNLIKEKYPHVNLVIGTHNIYMLQDYVDKLFSGQDKIIKVFSKEGDIIENIPKNRFYKHKAFVSIMDGCDEFCTYCIVPYTRGKERSRKPKNIIKEVKDLIKDGYKEVTLIGQNVDSYGLDFKDINYKFNNLLEDLANLDIKRIRFMTSYPRDITIETINVMAKYSNIMPSIHLPVQSGSDKILKRMNRHYTVKDFIEKVFLLRKAIPNITISTDIIVSFPGETKKDFNETIKLCKKIKFDGAFTFVYSKRSNTPAAKYDDQIDPKISHKRLVKLNKVINNIITKKNKKYKNQVIEVLVDGITNNKGYGYSKDNKIVNIDGINENDIGNFVNVLIDNTKTFTLYGRKVIK